jgi:predicted nucleotidyltransferase
MNIASPVSDDLLSQMAQVIVREVKPERIILFGSHARGEARPDSDVDLLVIEREDFGKQRSRRREASLLWRALARFPVPKDIVVYSQAEEAAWKGSPGHLVARALREGRVLYERGELASRLLVLARRDLRAAEFLRDQPDPGDSVGES